MLSSSSEGLKSENRSLSSESIQFIDDDVLQNDDFELSEISVPDLDDFESEELETLDQELESSQNTQSNNDQIIDEYIEDDFRSSFKID